MIGIRSVENEVDYDWAPREIERHFDTKPVPDTPEAARFSVLSTLIAA